MRRFLFTIHRFLGAILSIFFLMWFISGLVLIYRGYPRFTKKEALMACDPLRPEALPAADSVAVMLARAGIDTLAPYELSLENTLMGETVYTVSAGKNTIRMQPDGSIASEPKAVDEPYLHLLAKRWPNEEIVRIDTLHKLDVWTPFSRLRTDLPFYRLRLSGKEHRYLYVSSTTGKILSESTRSERFWAYVGAIPHWIYITGLRQNVELWKNVVIWIAAFGCFMVITGLYAGIDVYVRTRSKKFRGLKSPYTKRRYRWHHLFGTLGGIFILTWIFSGMMSLIDLPDWVTGVPADRPRVQLAGEQIPPHTFPADYRKVLKDYPETRRIIWTSFAGHTLMKIDNGEKEMVLDAGEKMATPLSLNQNECLASVKKAYGIEPEKVETMTRYDGYYHDRKGRLALPVYKITLDDPYETVVYMDPASDNYRIVDREVRLNRWMFSKLHNLSFSNLTRYPWLWTLVMWVLLLTGVLVSATGVWMGVDYFRRITRKKKNKRKKSNH